MLLRAKDILVSLVNLSALKRSGKTKETREEKKMKAKEFWRTLKTRIWQQKKIKIYLFIFSSFLCCRTHSLDIFSFSNNTVFLLVHRNSLLLGSQSELSKFSKLSWSPFNGYAIRHKFPSSSSSKLTDTTPEEKKHPDSYELLKWQASLLEHSILH